LQDQHLAFTAEASTDINIAIEYARRLTNDLGR
jgi:hypothetical protein